MFPRWQRVFLIPLLTVFMPLNWSGPARGAGVTTKTVKGGTAEGKKTGFAGDPSRKRGLEIGFDLGRKDGKADQTQNLKPDPKRYEGFEKPEKYWRSEYGSQAAFAGGFRSGYIGGYMSVFGKKIPLGPSMAGGGTGAHPKSAVSGPKPPTSSASSDAL